MVSTHMHRAVIPTSVSKGFLRACILAWSVQFHASCIYKCQVGTAWQKLSMTSIYNLNDPFELPFALFSGLKINSDVKFKDEF